MARYRNWRPNRSSARDRSEAVLRLVPGAFDDAAAITMLVNVLCTDDDLNVVEDATWVLVRHGDAATTALLDVIKHADARQIIVRAVESGERLTLSVHDDGRGFSLDDRKGTSLGLDIMQERANTIGALLTVYSAQGSGTQISITWERDKGQSK